MMIDITLNQEIIKVPTIIEDIEIIEDQVADLYRLINLIDIESKVEGIKMKNHHIETIGKTHLIEVRIKNKK